LLQAWTLARDTTGPNTETDAVAASALATAVYERGGVDQAETLLLNALPAIEQGESWFDLLAGGYLTAMAIAAERSEPNALHELAHRARETSARRDIERLLRIADIIDLRGHILSGRLGHRAVALLEASLVSGLAREFAPRIQLRIQLELARLALARGGLQMARTAGARLARESWNIRHSRVTLEARLVEAIAAHGLNETHAAEEALASAINLAMHEGFRQVFCDFGDALRPLLDDANELGRDAAAPRVRDRFLQSVVEGMRMAAPSGGAGPHLSDRERAVLRLLGQGLSNKAIARALRVSDNTVKFHLKNVFAKLGVSTRSEAVQLAAPSRPET
jgi:LuxR family maltose regulon positive regulatory protein